MTLLTKNEAILFLQETIDAIDTLRQDEVVYLVVKLKKLINKTECCIFDWEDVSNFYSNAGCLLQRALLLLPDQNVPKLIRTWIQKFISAEAACEPYLQEQVKVQYRNDDQAIGKRRELYQKIIELGFN